MTFQAKDANLATKEFKASGDGSSLKPFIPEHSFRFSDSPSVDAFGRGRFSQPETLFDSKQLQDNAPLYFDEVDSGGSETSVHTPANASTEIGVTANGEYKIRQTKRRFNYQPGKSMAIIETFKLGAPTANVLKRIGYYNSSISAPYTSNLDGIWFEQDGTTGYNITVSKNGVQNAVTRDSWDDKLDGTGQSGINLDFEKSVILVIDFAWLGVGAVRVGFKIGNQVIYAYTFEHVNELDNVYMSSPNHSIRYEIRSTGGADTLVHICSTVISEGGNQDLGRNNGETTGGTHIDLASENTIYALIGIRLKSTHLDHAIKILKKAILVATTGHEVEWLLLWNPTVAGAGWDATYADKSNSCIQVAKGDGTFTCTDGEILDFDYAVSSSGPGASPGANSGQTSNTLGLGSNIDGTRDEIILCARPINGSTAVDVEAGLLWRELN